MRQIRWPNIGFFILACALPLYAILLSTNETLSHTYLALMQAMLIGFSIQMTGSLSRRRPVENLKIDGPLYRYTYVGCLVLAAGVYVVWLFQAD